MRSNNKRVPRVKRKPLARNYSHIGARNLLMKRIKHIARAPCNAIFYCSGVITRGNNAKSLCLPRLHQLLVRRQKDPCCDLQQKHTHTQTQHLPAHTRYEICGSIYQARHSCVIKSGRDPGSLSSLYLTRSPIIK
jgi:hypothetical protein